MSKKALHGESPTVPEFTLCGLSFDAFETGDNDAEIIFAEKGQVITCQDCRRHIEEMRAYKTNFKQP